MYVIFYYIPLRVYYVYDLDMIISSLQIVPNGTRIV